MKMILVLVFLCLFHTLNAQQFKVTYTPDAFEGPFSGSVILYLSTKNEQPKDRTGWPCYRMQVRDVKAGEPVFFFRLVAILSYPVIQAGTRGILYAGRLGY